MRSGFLVSAATNDHQSTWRGKGQQLVMIVFEAGARWNAIEKAPCRTAKFGDGIVVRVDVIKWPLPVQIPRIVIV